MKRNHNFLERVTQFVSGKGFYLVAVCVAAIGVSGYFRMRSILSTEKNRRKRWRQHADAPNHGQRCPQRQPSASPR